MYIGAKKVFIGKKLYNSREKKRKEMCSTSLLRLTPLIALLTKSKNLVIIHRCSWHPHRGPCRSSMNYRSLVYIVKKITINAYNLSKALSPQARLG